MHITGSCHCGAITYEAELDPAKVAICHCEDCQRLSGSAFRTVAMVPDAGFVLLTGSPREYIKTAASGNKRVQAFCAECGAGLWATAPGDGPKVLGLRTGTINERAQLTPRVQVWHAHALGWLDGLAGIPAIEGQPPAPGKQGD